MTETTREDLKNKVNESFMTLFGRTINFSVNEVEFRIGEVFTKNTNFGLIYFDRLSRVLNSNDRKIVYQLVINQDRPNNNSRVVINGQDNIIHYCQTNQLPESGVVYETKERESTNSSDEIEKEYDIRLRMSEESIADASNFSWVEDKATPKIFRYRKRYTFPVSVSEDSGSINFDLSVYKTGWGNSFKSAVSKVWINKDKKHVLTRRRFLSDENTEYDIELEYSSPTGKFITKDMLSELVDRFIDPLYEALQVYNNSPLVIPKSIELDTLKKYSQMVGVDYRGDRTNFVGVSVYPMGLKNVLNPETYPEFELTHLNIDDYAYAFKADGVRNLLMIDEQGQSWLIDMNNRVKMLDLDPSEEMKNSLFDVELIYDGSDDQPPQPGKNYKILVFDVLIYNGKDVKKLPLIYEEEEEEEESRYGLVQKTTNSFRGGEYYSVQHKDYFTTDDDFVIEELILTQKNDELDFKKDGLILTHRTRAYPDLSTYMEPGEKEGLSIGFAYKIKNLEQLTVDFMYKPTKNMRESSNEVNLWIRRDSLVPFDPVYPIYDNNSVSYVGINRQNETSNLQEYSENMRTEEDKFLIVRDFVYESRFDPKSLFWIPTRLRPIKTLKSGPNVFRTSNSTWELILNVLQNPPMKVEEDSGMIDIGELTEDNFVELLSLFIKDKKFKSGQFHLFLNERLNKPMFYLNSELNSLYDQSKKNQEIILPMNVCHNQIKSILYRDAVKNVRTNKKIRLLELASGAGADYIRWSTSGIDEVVGIELDELQINQANYRYQQQWKSYNINRKKNTKIRQPINVIYCQGDITQDLNSGQAGKTDNYKEKLRNVLGDTPSFDIVSCQFAIHFALKDETTWSQFLLNVSQNLKTGGYFIGTSFVPRRSEKESEQKEIGPGVFDALEKTESGVLSYTVKQDTGEEDSKNSTKMLLKVQKPPKIALPKRPTKRPTPENCREMKSGGLEILDCYLGESYPNKLTNFRVGDLNDEEKFNNMKNQTLRGIVEKIFPKKIKNKENLIGNRIGVYSLTTEAQAKDIEKHLNNFVKRFDLPKSDVLVDMNPGLGGTELNMSEKYNKVYAIETDDNMIEAFTTNMQVADLADKIELIKGDSSQFVGQDMFKDSITSIDAPWGGIDYRENEKLSEVKLGDNDIIDVVNNLLKSNNSPNIIMVKVPNNYDFSKFYEKVKTDRIITNGILKRGRGHGAFQIIFVARPSEEVKKIWEIEKIYEGSELKDFGQEISVYLISLQYQAIREYLFNINSERIREIALRHNLKLVKLPNSVGKDKESIGHNDMAQSFGEVYQLLKKNKLKPVSMGQVDFDKMLEKLLSNEKLLEFSLFNSLFVFQKLEVVENITQKIEEEEYET
jgi:cyclopropane fatty-acyl-phospholipid synthase-like methyltransferase